MPDVGTAYVQIVPSAKGIGGAISKELGGEASEAGKTAGNNIAGTLVKALGGAMAALGVKQIITDALDAGGALEQSFGGLETIYGDAADQAKQFAMEASKAGISANDYAEQAVGFGASLKQAFGGDTEKAVEAANTAIMDMTDNAAKMGTPIESIQAAYQGFAKQNYQMLDNLRIGYNGSKTEMERLLKDAQKISGVEYDISNLGDVYDAIHVIQGELGLTGVAAAEANSTLQGSFGAMKAAYQNFLATLTTGGDITAPLQTLIQSVSTYLFGNLLPAIGNILMQIPNVATTAFTTIAPMIGSAFQTLVAQAPAFIQSGVLMLHSMINGFFTALPEFLASANTMLSNFLTAVTQRLPEILAMGVTLINRFVTGFLNNLPTFITAAGQMISRFLAFILQNLPSILQSGVKIMLNLVQGFRDNFPKIISAIRDALANFIQTIIENLPTILAKGAEMLRNLAQGVLNTIPTLVSAAASAMGDFISDIVSHLPEILAKGKEIIDNLVQGVKNKVSDFVSAAGELINDFKDKFTSFDWAGLGSDLIAGIKNGIASGAGAIADAARDAAQSAFNAAKRLLQIGSPSKLFANGVGKWIPAGIAVGITKNLGAIEKAMDQVTTEATGVFSADLSSSGLSYGSETSGTSGSGFSQTVNIYAPQELNPSEVARQTRNATQQMILSLSGV